MSVLVSILYDLGTIADIDDLAAKNAGLFLVIIDGLNKFSKPESVLEDISRWTWEGEKRFGRVRVCITCWKETWEYLIREKRTFLPSSLTYKPPSQWVSNVRRLREDPRCVDLEGFDDQELAIAERLYRRVYRFKGKLSEEAREVCRDPFILGMVFKRFKGQELPSEILETELLEEYWNKTVGSPGSNKRFINRLYIIVYILHGIVISLCLNTPSLLSSVPNVNGGRLERLSWVEKAITLQYVNPVFACKLRSLLSVGWIT